MRSHVRRPGESGSPHPVDGTALRDGTLSAVLEPPSWNVIPLA
ncbi:hypothetical protein ACFW7K_08275 [Streptomyces sp. NPDC058735]